MYTQLGNSTPETAAFDAVAEKYDDAFSNSPIGRAQRQSVWKEMDRVFHAGQRLLEINCGTGVDALHLANRGVRVVACDSSPRMIAEARRRIGDFPSRASVELRCLPTEQIAQLETSVPFDGAFSNFAGLNCVSDVEQVARDMARLIRPGGKLVVCLFGRVCLWEIFWYVAHGKVRKAFRRFRQHCVTATLAPGSTVTVGYPSVRLLRHVFSPYFQLEYWTGVGVTTPPSYAAPLAARFPRLFELATEIDSHLGACPGFRAMADHVVLTFTRSGQ